MRCTKSEVNCLNKRSYYKTVLVLLSQGVDSGNPARPSYPKLPVDADVAKAVRTKRLRTVHALNQVSYVEERNGME